MVVAATAPITIGIERAHGRRQYEQDGDRQQCLHELSGSALPGDDPQGTADVVHVAAVADATMDVPGDAAGQREVEEHRPVVGRDGSGQRQAEPQAASNDRPPPGTAKGGDEADDRRRSRARPSTARTPSRNGPTPRRQMTKMSVTAAATRRTHESRLSRQHQQVGVGDGDGEPTCFRLSQTPVPIAIGVGGEPGLLLARGPQPSVEPFDGQAGLGGAEPPWARPDDDLGAQPAELIDSRVDGIRAEQTAARRQSALVRIERGRRRESRVDPPERGRRDR